MLKRRKANERSASQQRLESDIAKKERGHKKRGLRENFKRAEEFVTRFRTQEASARKLRRVVSKPLGAIPPVANETVTLVVRNKPVANVVPKIMTTLRALHLPRMYTAVFVRRDAKTLGRLRLVDSFVLIGQPSLASVKELIYKRGFAKINQEHRPLTDNRLIEQHLGDVGILCLEDLVSQIYNVGPHFDRAIKFLWPIKFETPKPGLKEVTSHFTRDKADPLETPIDEFIRKHN